MLNTESISDYIRPSIFLLTYFLFFLIWYVHVYEVKTCIRRRSKIRIASTLCSVLLNLERFFAEWHGGAQRNNPDGKHLEVNTEPTAQGRPSRPSFG